MADFKIGNIVKSVPVNFPSDINREFLLKTDNLGVVSKVEGGWISVIYSDGEVFTYFRDELEIIE